MKRFFIFTTGLLLLALSVGGFIHCAGIAKQAQAAHDRSLYLSGYSAGYGAGQGDGITVGIRMANAYRKQALNLPRFTVSAPKGARIILQKTDGARGYIVIATNARFSEGQKK